MKPQAIKELVKKCPMFAETIKLEALKCRFCGHESNPEEIKANIKSLEEMASKGKKQCPLCGEWDV